MNQINVNKFKGVFPALLTPFDEHDEFAPKELEKLIDWNVKKGCAGFYVSGSTGEAFLLSEAERRAVYDTAAQAAGGRATLIAHIGCIGQKQAIEYAKYAKSLGYDAISSVAPFYYKFSFDQIKRYYYAIVDAVDMPMVIYNIPVYSGVNLTVDQVGQFLCDDRFIGLKHTSNDYFALQTFKAAFPNKVVFNGYDEMFLCGLAMGADGGIGSTYNFMAEKFITMQKLYAERKNEEALAVQTEANRIISVLCKVGVMEGEKEILNQLGFNFGRVRAPFGELNDEQKQFIRNEVTSKL